MNFYTCFHNAFGNLCKRSYRGIQVPKPDIFFRYSPQLFMRINLVIFFIALACFKTTASVYAQGISIRLNNAPFEKVLTAIEKQSGYRFWYNRAILKQSKPVNISISNANLDQALKASFTGQPFDYIISDKTIVVKESTFKGNSMNAGSEAVITGRVIDEAGKPLSGASVKVKGTNLATNTGPDGVFTLKEVEAGAVLLVSYVGYNNQEVVSRNAITITLTKASSKLDDVQIIGYGTTTRRLSTGSINTVKAVDIENQPVSNPLAALQGRVPGLVISQTSGVPGSSFNIQIRGQSALDLSLSQNNPLFIIDGVPFESGNAPVNQISNAANNPIAQSTNGLSPLNSINPQDIESIDVLKDADATSIYGSRGANGVILITTKKGIPGKTNINVNVNTGFSKVGRTMDMLNTQQYVVMRKEAFANDGLIPSSVSSNAGYAPDIMLWDTTRYTDFKRLLIGNTANTSNIQASVSGGNTLTQFRIGANYHRETTVYLGDYSDNIASLNFNINHSTSDKKFTIQLTGMYSSDKNKMPKIDLTRYIDQPPNLRLFDGNGNISWNEAGVEYSSFGSIFNPYAVITQTYGSLNENLSGNINTSLVLWKGLTFKANLGYNTFSTEETTTRPKAAINPLSSELPSAAFAKSNNRNWIAEPQLEYNYSSAIGKFNIMLGATWQDKTRQSSTQNGGNYTSDLLLNSIAAAGIVTARNDFSKYRYHAFFGRINYNYADKYIINISARRDGSSRFGPDKQFANFGAVGMAYLFTNENIFKESLSFLSFGKIRSSYGTTGNDQIGDYKFLNLWSNTSQAYNGMSGLYPVSLFNPDYSWEINKKFEAAIDLGFLKDNILFSAAYYNNRGSNQLIRYLLPTQTGFGSVIKNFPGLVQNSGIEFTLTTKNINSKHLNWTTAFNISVPKNKLISFPGLSSSSYSTRYVEGKSLGILRGFNYLGVDPQTGLYTYEDVDRDGTISNGDYQYFDDIDPRFYGGLQNNISYKGFDLGFFFQFTKTTGLNYINQLASTRPGSLMNQPTIVFTRWQKPGDVTDVQKFSQLFFPSAAATANTTLSLSQATYTDASFIKLKNISLAYRIPGQLTKKLNLAGCRFYAEAQNLFTITNYKGADPESQNFYILPPLKTLVLGIQINL